jgi:hypothetical protein
MNELFQMASDLEMHLHRKEQFLEDQDAYISGKIKNIRAKISNFKERIKDVSNDPTLKNQILFNFNSTRSTSNQ